MTKKFNLSERRQDTNKSTDFVRYAYLEEDIKEFIQKITSFNTTHDCEIKGYKCHCADKSIEDQNCWVVPKEALRKLAGDKLI